MASVVSMCRETHVHYLRGEVSIEACSPHDEPAEDEGDAQQGEQAATCGALVARWSSGQLGVLHTHMRAFTGGLFLQVEKYDYIYSAPTLNAWIG